MKIAIRKCSPRAEAVEASPRVLCLSFIRTVKDFIVVAVVVAATHVLIVVVVVANAVRSVCGSDSQPVSQTASQPVS